MTAIAAAITAVAGLVAALNQAGFFKPKEITGPAQVATDPTTKPAEHKQLATDSVPPSSSADAERSGHPTKLPMTGDAHLGDAFYKILDAQIDRYNAENLSLQIQPRMTNNSAYPANL